MRRLLLSTAALIPCVSLAHDVWVTTDKRPAGAVAVINYGDTDKRELVDRSRIVDFDLITTAGATDLRKTLSPATAHSFPVLETGVLPASTGGIISVSYDNGFWVTRPGDQKETNTSPLMEPKAIEPHWTVKYGKHLIGPGSYSVPAKARGEFSVTQDPFKLGVGKKLPVKVMIDGKPQPNVRVRYADGIEALSAEKIPFVKTNAEGIAEVPLERKGAYLITADPSVAPSHPALSKSDHVYIALSFDLTQ